MTQLSGSASPFVFLHFLRLGWEIRHSLILRALVSRTVLPRANSVGHRHRGDADAKFNYFGRHYVSWFIVRAALRHELAKSFANVIVSTAGNCGNSSAWCIPLVNCRASNTVTIRLREKVI